MNPGGVCPLPDRAVCALRWAVLRAASPNTLKQDCARRIPSGLQNVDVASWSSAFSMHAPDEIAVFAARLDALGVEHMITKRWVEPFGLAAQWAGFRQLSRLLSLT